MLIFGEESQELMNKYVVKMLNYILTTVFICMNYIILQLNVYIFPVIYKLLFKLIEKKNGFFKPFSVLIH